MMWKALMWLAVLATIGSCVTVPHIGWAGWLVVFFLWRLADVVDTQEARIQELEARHTSYDDYEGDLADLAAAKSRERRELDNAGHGERESPCSSCGRVLTDGDRFCASCGTPRPDSDAVAPAQAVPSASDTIAIEKVVPKSVVDHPEFGRCIVVGVDWETMRGQELRFVTLKVNRTQKLERIGMLALGASGARVVR